MGQEMGDKFTLPGESSEAMLKRLSTSPRAGTTPIAVVIAGLKFGPSTPSISTPEQGGHTLRPSNTDISSADSTRRSPENLSNSDIFPLPPGYSMIWQTTRLEGSSPNFVVQRPNDAGEMTTVLAITSSLDDTNPRFSVPQAPDFQTALQVLAPHIIHRITKPQNMTQEAFDNAKLVMQNCLAEVYKNISYSEKDRGFKIGTQNQDLVFNSLMTIAQALSLIYPRKDEIIGIAFSADTLSLGL